MDAKSAKQYLYSGALNSVWSKEHKGCETKMTAGAAPGGYLLPPPPFQVLS